MRYNEIYHSLIKRAKDEFTNGLRREGYFEKHHIIPKSISGDNSDENLVRLTPREHFIAHLLLTKIYKTGTSEHQKMIFALWRMLNGHHKLKLTSRSYELLRIQFLKYMSIVNSANQRGNKNSQYGKIWYTNYITGISKSFKGTPEKEWIKGRNLFHGESCKLENMRNKEKRKMTSKLIWNEFHSDSYSSIRQFCRINNRPLKFVTGLLREIPLFNKVFIPRSHNNGSKIEYVNRFEE